MKAMRKFGFTPVHYLEGSMNDDTPLLILLLLCSWFASLILASRLMIVIFQLISSHKKECSVSEKQKICMIVRTLIKEKQQTFPERMN